MSTETPAGEAKLPRVLGPMEAFCVVVGSVIGSGIFIVPSSVARNVPFIAGIAFVWIVGGLFSMAGALTLAELGAMLPSAGGPYVYLREAFGRLPAFLFGWTEFLVIRTGSIATLAAAFGLNFGFVFFRPDDKYFVVWQTLAAVVAIITLTAVNVIGTRFGGWVQVIGTVLKIGALVTMIVLPFVLGKADPKLVKPMAPEGPDLRVMPSLKVVEDIPDEGKNVMVLAEVDQVLYLRIFDGYGNKVVNTDEKQLKLSGSPEKVNYLKDVLGKVRASQPLDEGDSKNVIEMITSTTKYTIPSPYNLSILAGIMAAMISVLWTYDGWVNAAALAEEIKEPGKNIPRALILGLLALIAIYLSMTLVYHLVLPMGVVKYSPGIISANFMKALIGNGGPVLISVVIMTSTFITLNGNALSGPRAYFAMARDGVFPRALCKIDSKHQTPANAIIAQAVWAVVLIVAASTFLLIQPPKHNPSTSLEPPLWLSAWMALHKKALYDILYTYVIFGGTIFYGLAIVSVFVLRRTRPDLPRPYKTWGYPVTPILYTLASLFLLGSMLYQSVIESLAGLAIVAAGLPAYLIFSRKSSDSLLS